jgi:hypothetical protein
MGAYFFCEKGLGKCGRAFLGAGLLGDAYSHPSSETYVGIPGRITGSRVHRRPRIPGSRVHRGCILGARVPRFKELNFKVEFER